MRKVIVILLLFATCSTYGNFDIEEDYTDFTWEPLHFSKSNFDYISQSVMEEGHEKVNVNFFNNLIDYLWKTRDILGLNYLTLKLEFIKSFRNKRDVEKLQTHIHHRLINLYPL